MELQHPQGTLTLGHHIADENRSFIHQIKSFVNSVRDHMTPKTSPIKPVIIPSSKAEQNYHHDKESAMTQQQMLSVSTTPSIRQLPEEGNHTTPVSGYLPVAPSQYPNAILPYSQIMTPNGPIQVMDLKKYSNSGNHHMYYEPMNFPLYKNSITPISSQTYYPSPSEIYRYGSPRTYPTDGYQLAYRSDQKIPSVPSDVIATERYSYIWKKLSTNDQLTPDEYNYVCSQLRERVAAPAQYNLPAFGMSNRPTPIKLSPVYVLPQPPTGYTPAGGSFLQGPSMSAQYLQGDIMRETGKPTINKKKKKKVVVNTEQTPATKRKHSDEDSEEKIRTRRRQKIVDDSKKKITKNKYKQEREKKKERIK